MGVVLIPKVPLKRREVPLLNTINSITCIMSKNMYGYLLQNISKNQKINWWCTGRKLPTTSLHKTLVIPKGIFFRTLSINKLRLGRITGSFISTRKPFVKPLPKNRR